MSSRLLRRLSGLAALGVALLGSGAAYTALVPEPQAAYATADSALIARGQQIYTTTCLTCHGPT